MANNNLSSFATNIQSGATAVATRVSAGVTAGGSFLKSVLGKALPPGGESQNQSRTIKADFASAAPKDWRVKLSLPNDINYQTSPMLEPLRDANAMVFPFTPTITISHQASYSAMEPMHNNYAFVAYENSKIDRMTITGDFYVENSVEAAYWVAVLHYLRSVTKMYYGENTANAGAPPPVLRLNGYGDHVFNNVPVVVTNFTIELPKEVDYISAVGRSATATGKIDETTTQQQITGVSYAPTRSTITVTVQPVYSREQVRQFNLKDFVNGAFIGKGVI